ncbi:MAG TPA: LysR substrate-binding domain-containing protein [Burkholderiaceae bacterium]|jgi:LysR family hydrogen peroxide-inducible transcriptional activator|nr:LysR substrate-binding domain-containing protein [Burkholderiaceae bacterium]
MTLQELRYLVALADKGHFARAAEACCVGQPTLSTQLKKLEDYLGVTLFERNKHQLRPTPIGEKIVERARIALDVVEQIRQLARDGHDPMNGPLRLGVIPTLGPYLIPNLLPAIRDTYRQLRLFLREDLTANLLERLRQGRLDALLLALPVRGEDIEVMELFREPFMVALPNGHPLTRETHITEEELAKENVLLLEEGHCLRDQALAICGATPSEEREELKATSLETLRQMVAAGAGCTLLPKLAANPGIGSVQDGMVQIRPLAPPSPTRLIGIVWRHRYPREATVRGLAELILTNLPPGVQRVSLRESAQRKRSGGTRIDRGEHAFAAMSG